MTGDPSSRLAELRSRTWSTAAEYDALNRDYDAVLAELALSLQLENADQLATIAGGNASDRQSLKRKAARWKSTFREMPAIERATLFVALCEAMADDAN